MRCEAARAHLPALHDGELRSSLAWRLRQHTRRCPACAAELASLAALHGLLRANDLLPPTTGAIVRPAALGPFFRWLPAGAAVTALALAGSAWWVGGPGRRPSAHGPARLAQRTPNGPLRTSPPPAAWKGRPQGGSPVTPAVPGAVPSEHPRPTSGPGTLRRASPTAGPAARTLNGGHLRPAAGTPERPPADEWDGYDSHLLEHWTATGGKTQRAPEQLTQRLPRLRDDFVMVPAPRFASAGAGGLGATLREYEAQAKVVDARLFRKVTVGLKGASLEECCAELERQTGVAFRASRGIGDEKVTVFVKDVPARDVMRAVIRLFAYAWARTGEEGAYRYELIQHLRSQLAEEELRNRDRNAAFLALDEAMEAYRPLADRRPDDLRNLLDGAAGAEKQRLQRLVEQGGWGGLQAYERLSPAERLALRNGERLELKFDAAQRDRQLPADWVRPVLESYRVQLTVHPNGITVGQGPLHLEDVAQAQPSVALAVDRSELGELSLQAHLQVMIPFADGMGSAGTGTVTTLAVGRSPSVARPDNATANRAERTQPFFKRTVSLRPQSACPRFTGPTPEQGPAHVTTAEVWEAVHRATGAPVVADFYTRLYPVTAVTVERAPLFEVLCRAGDAVGVRWKKDGDFLLARSTSYFWDKLKEVPNRHLRRWQAHRQAGGELPLAELLELAQLSDAQLDSRFVDEAVRHCWGLEEWGIVSLSRTGMRGMARFLGSLNEPQRAAAFSPRRLSLRDLGPAQQQEFARLNPQVLQDPAALSGARLGANYIPAGRYTLANDHDDRTAPPIAESTADAALAAARQRRPTAGPRDIQRSRGDLSFVTLLGNGQGWGQGRGYGWSGRVTPP